MSSLRMAWMLSVLNFSPGFIHWTLSFQTHWDSVHRQSQTLIPLPPDTSHLPARGARVPASEGIEGSGSLAQRKENGSNHSRRYFPDLVHWLTASCEGAFQSLTCTKEKYICGVNNYSWQPWQDHHKRHNDLTEAQVLHGRGFTLDIWLKSAKPSALLKDPLPKGSKVPKWPASSTNRGRVTGHPRTRLLRSKESIASWYPIALEAGNSGGHISLLGSCFWVGLSHWFRRGG